MKRSLVLAIALAMCPAGALADDLADCMQTTNYDLRIRGCSALMKSKGLAPWQQANLYLYRGQAYFLKGDHDHAIGDCGKAITLKPLVQAYTCRGAAYGEKGDYDRAIADLTILVRSKPSAEHYYNRSLMFYKKGEYDRALDDVNRSLEIDPSDRAAITLQFKIQIKK
jgi:tetratricopeptide (TPR) repeat protein